MPIVYILLGVILALFLVLFVVVFIRYNNKKIEGELEYLAENYEINALNDMELMNQNPTIYHQASNVKYYQPQMNQYTPSQPPSQPTLYQIVEHPSVPVQPVTEAPIVEEKKPTAEELAASAAIAQSIADSLHQPYYKEVVKEPVQQPSVAQPQQPSVQPTATQSIPVQDPNVSPFAEHNKEENRAPNLINMPTLHTNDLTDQSVEIPGITAPEVNVQDNMVGEEQIVVEGSKELVEEGEEFVVEDTAIPAETQTEAPAVVIEEPKPVAAPVQPAQPTNQVPVGTDNAREKAFQTAHDGNTIINENINYVEPKKEFDSYKTEIWDMSEVIEELNKNE